MSNITLKVFQGIGDIFWVYQKASLHYDKIDFVISIEEVSDLKKRAKSFLQLLPKVRNVFFDFITQDEYNNFLSDTYDFTSIVESGSDFASYSCNKPLEQGIRLEDIDKKYPVEWDIPINDRWMRLKFKEYVCLYASFYEPSWDAITWVNFVKTIYQINKIDLPIILIGANYDAQKLNDISELLTWSGFSTDLYIDSEAANVCYILKKAKLFIGHQSGLSILADNLNTKQVMIYIPELKQMPYSWIKPSHISSDLYQVGFFDENYYEIAKRLVL